MPTFACIAETECQQESKGYTPFVFTLYMCFMCCMLYVLNKLKNVCTLVGHVVRPILHQYVR